MQRTHTVLYEGTEVSKILSIIEQDLVTCFMTVFNTKGFHEWEESWTADSTRILLETYLGQAEGKIPVLAVMYNKSNRVVGFLFGATILRPEVYKGYGLPNSDKYNIHHSKINSLINKIEKDLPYPLYFSCELGIYKEFRGGVKPLANLFVPVLTTALRHECKYAIGFTAFGKKSHILMMIFGSVLAELGGHQNIVVTKHNIMNVLRLIPWVVRFQRIFFKFFLLIKRIKGIR